MQNRICSRSSIIKVTLISVMLIAALVASTFTTDAFSVSSTTGSINARGGAALRTKASTKGAKIAVLSRGTRVTIIREVFKSKKSVKKSKRWYLVTAGGRSGYVRADLVNNIAYCSASVKTTAKVKFRKGAGNKMKKKGSFKKGQALTAVLQAKAADGSIWYKVRKGSGFVYVSGKYLTDNVQTTDPASTDNSASATAAALAAAPDPDAPLSITANNVRTPDDRVTNLPFTVLGTINSNHIIESVEVGVVKASGGWAIRATQNVNKTSFNIASVDAQLKFGTIPAGSYFYRVNVKVDGEWHTPVDKAFTVRTAEIPAKLTQTALSLAWPAGTSSSTFDYSGGAPTAAFTAALNAAYPNRSNWSTAPRKGASCDVFVGTTVRTSGYDPNYPRGWDEQYDYLQKSDKWVRIAYSGDLSKLQSGDIVLYKRDSGGCHTCIYVKIGSDDYLAEAQIEKRYGYLKSDVSKIQKFSDKKFIVVYRATN